MLKFNGISTLIITVLILSACSLAEDITPPPGAQLPSVQQATQSISASPVYPIVPPDLTNGAKIYAQECVQCHGSKGLGDGPRAGQLSVPVASLGLSDFARQYSPAEWYNVVTKGNMEKFMPAFANLTDRQRWDVVAYAMSLSSPAEVINQGKSLYQENCESCHGKSGNGNGPNAAGLSTQPTDFTSQAFMAGRTTQGLYDAITTGIGPDMPSYGGSLDDSQRMAVVSYLRSLTNSVSEVSANTYPPPAAVQSASNSAYPYPASQTSINLTPTQVPTSTASTEISPTEPIIGSVSVQLVNGSGGTVPSDASVTLYGFDNMQNTYSDTLTSGVNGVYTFLNVVMPQGRAFLAGVDYAAATYGSDIAVVDPSTPNLSLQITIYDTSTDASGLTTDRLHLLFDFSTPGIVQVVEVFIISNPTNQTIIAPSEDGTVVAFPLPEGYTNLEFQDGTLGDRYIETSQGFADTSSVSPGQDQYQVIFAFQMPYNRRLEFVQPMSLPTNAVVVMIPDNGVRVSSSMLEDGGTRDYQSTTYRMYNGNSLIAGSNLEFNLSGTPKNGASSLFSTGTTKNLAFGLGVFGIALLVAGLVLYSRHQRTLAAETALGTFDIAAPYTGENVTPEDEETLMDAIIALDDQYHAGNLPQDAYLERRAALKEKLSRLDNG
jgi:cbb3-type cytochrome c oxidase subunit III